MIIAMMKKRLTLDLMKQGMESTAKLSAFVMFILVGATALWGGGRLKSLNGDFMQHSVHEIATVGDLRATSAHAGKCGVTGRIEERDAAAVLQAHLIGADMLGNAAGFTGDHVSLAQGVKQRGLAVIDVTHDRHDGWTDDGRDIRTCAGDGQFETVLESGVLDCLGDVAHFLDHQHRSVLVKCLVDGGHHTTLHHHLDKVAGLDGLPQVIDQAGDEGGKAHQRAVHVDLGADLGQLTAGGCPPLRETRQHRAIALQLVGGDRDGGGHRRFHGPILARAPRVPDQARRRFASGIGPRVAPGPKA